MLNIASVKPIIGFLRIVTQSYAITLIDILLIVNENNITCKLSRNKYKISCFVNEIFCVKLFWKAILLDIW